MRLSKGGSYLYHHQTYAVSIYMSFNSQPLKTGSIRARGNYPAKAVRIPETFHPRPFFIFLTELASISWYRSPFAVWTSEKRPLETTRLKKAAARRHRYVGSTRARDKRLGIGIGTDADLQFINGVSDLRYASTQTIEG